MKKFTTKQLVTDAMLAAVCAVLGAFGPDFGNLKITFEGLPVILGGLLFGPLDALAVGGIGTLLYQLLRYGVTVTTPLWILPYMLCGLLVGELGRRSPEKNRARLGAVVLAGEGLIFLLNTLVLYADSKIYGYYSPVFIFGSMPLRALICALKAVLYAAVLPPLLSILHKSGVPSGKTLQRERATAARRRLPEQQRREAARAICERLLSLPQVQKAGMILSYQALPEEADLTELHQKLQERGVRLCFPVSLSGGVMETWEPKGWKLGRYGIREPDQENSRLVSPQEIELILAPCVGFDRRGNRLGHGAGYYDRFLEACTAPVIAVAFEAQKLPRVVTESHDRPVDAVVTEKAIYFNKK